MARGAPLAVIWIFLSILSGLTSDLVLPPLATRLTALNERLEVVLRITSDIRRECTKVALHKTASYVPQEQVGTNAYPSVASQGNQPNALPAFDPKFILMEDILVDPLQPDTPLEKKAVVIEQWIRWLHLTEVSSARELLSLQFPPNFPGKSIYESPLLESVPTMINLMDDAFYVLRTYVFSDAEYSTKEEETDLGKRFGNIQVKLKQQQTPGVPPLFALRNDGIHNLHPSISSFIKYRRAIYLLYCNEDDPKTYITMVWHPMDSRYTLAKLMAYITRVYHFRIFISWPHTESPEKAIESFVAKLKRKRAGACDINHPESAQFVVSYLADYEEVREAKERRSSVLNT